MCTCHCILCALGSHCASCPRGDGDLDQPRDALTLSRAVLGSQIIERKSA